MLSECESCGLSDTLGGGRINGTLFEKYLSWFLRDNPFEDCPKAGHASYGNAVTYDTNQTNGYSHANASYFMTYHSILKTSADYIEAMEQAREIAQNITDTLNART